MIANTPNTLKISTNAYELCFNLDSPGISAVLDMAAKNITNNHPALDDLGAGNGQDYGMHIGKMLRGMALDMQLHRSGEYEGREKIKAEALDQAVKICVDHIMHLVDKTELDMALEKEGAKPYRTFSECLPEATADFMPDNVFKQVKMQLEIAGYHGDNFSEQVKAEVEKQTRH